MFLAAFRAVSLEGRSAELRTILRSRLAELTTGEGRLRSQAAARILKQASTALMLQLVLGAKDGSEIAGELTDAYDDYAPNGMPIVFEGFLIPRRSRVRICIWEAHRDPGQFLDPDVFKPDRFVDKKFSGASYAPLGLDHHRCLGAGWTVQLSGMRRKKSQRQRVRDCPLNE